MITILSSNYRRTSYKLITQNCLSILIYIIQTEINIKEQSKTKKLIKIIPKSITI